MPYDEPSKSQYRTKIESYYTSSDARRMWQGLQTIRLPREAQPRAAQWYEPNYFCARLEASNTEACMNVSCSRPVALTPVVTKSSERLVMAHVNIIIPETLDPLQFAYRPNRSTDDAISIWLHTALYHLDKRNTYVRMLFIDYSSVFNTIVLSKLLTKLRILGLNTFLCNWISATSWWAAPRW
jgi:hypothetical protein